MFDLAQPHAVEATNAANHNLRSEHLQNSNNSLTQGQMHDELRNQLTNLFSQLQLSQDDQNSIIRDLSDHLSAVAAKNYSGPIKWTKRVRQTMPPELTLPDKAPAIWRVDKLPSDKPPDFIRRHYGPNGLKVLRHDGSGLKRSDLRRLDESLYVALQNWLKDNELPPDCPVPTKSEAIDFAVQNLDRRTIEAARSLAYRERSQGKDR